MSKKSIRQRERKLQQQLPQKKVKPVIVDSVEVNNDTEGVLLRQLLDESRRWPSGDPSGRNWANARKGNGQHIKVSTR